MLIGSTNGSVELNKFTFDGPISSILQRKSITFTLLGYCIDDKCTSEVSHNFDKGPTSNEIQSGEVKKRGIDIDPSGVADKVGEAANNAGEIAKDAGGKAGEIAQDAGGKAGEIAQDAGEKAGEIAQDASEKAGEIAQNIGKKAATALLSAFDSFLPKEPTNGKSGWIARPIITASIFDALAFLLILITTTDNRKYCYPSAFILLLVSFILNIVSFFVTFSLFSLVFNVIGAFPGIGDNKTGSAIYLSGFSSVSLLITINLIIIDSCRSKKNK
ncbi:putative phage-related minor tail protein [Rhizophagus irregularis DAOM 181602=DAOM 197198]|nr:putative phage-related minor tail protein [Rhizophagus irregularis DAOM 181602=DAOM 197198]CAB5204021.1 unnamed protein product [Rhizophagus irregularis]CAG8476259.1 22876_t:CDS:2 [Rhizophagus irregularis]